MDWLVSSINAKLRRAEDHIRAMYQIVESGAVTDLLTTRTDRDRKGRVRVRVKEMREIPDNWRVVIGECVHDMRSALDHLAYGLNIVGSRQDPPPNHEASQFPIFDTRRRYRAGTRSTRPDKGPITHFPPGARTRVERLQPYVGKKHDPFTNRRLRDLSDLSNIDKHRRLAIAAGAPDQFISPDRVQGHRVTDVWSQHRLLKPDTTIFWFVVPTLPRDVKEPNVDFHFRARVEVEGPGANPPVRLLRPHEPVTFTLEMILRFIRERVLPEFEKWVPGISTGH